MQMSASHSIPELTEDEAVAQQDWDDAGADMYLRCMWDEAEASGDSVNWHAIDAVYAEGGYKDAPGYPTPSIQ
jgi:hypothetical protein